MSLLQAVSQAGGTLIREAFPSQVAVGRGSLTAPQVAFIDMNAILRGEAKSSRQKEPSIYFSAAGWKIGRNPPTSCELRSLRQSTD